MRLSNTSTIVLCLLLAVAGCKRTPDPPATPPASAPEAAVLQLAKHLHDNDLEAFARAAVPATEHARLETAWTVDRSRWPLTELPLEDQWQPMLAALSAKGAETTLQQSFTRNFANQHRDLKEAAHSLGLFGVQYVKNEGVYTDEERAHYAQLIAALAAWAESAPLGDPKRSKAAIPALVAAARKTGLDSEQAFHAAGMQGSLRQLGPFLAQVKLTLADYGLPLDESFAGLRTELVEQKGDQARVRVHYPLGKREVDTVVSLQRREGRWYLADYLRHVEQALAVPAAEAAPSFPGKEQTSD